MYLFLPSFDIGAQQFHNLLKSRVIGNVLLYGRWLVATASIGL